MFCMLEQVLDKKINDISANFMQEMFVEYVTYFYKAVRKKGELTKKKITDILCSDFPNHKSVFLERINEIENSSYIDKVLKKKAIDESEDKIYSQ